jgi:hypothetical protein
MVRTQIQLPDHLYREVKTIAEQRELSFAELTRRGLEYVVRVYQPLGDSPVSAKWRLPDPIDFGGAPLVSEENWREVANESYEIPDSESHKGQAR